MTNIDPLATSAEITQTYGRYLKSLVQPRQKALSDAIAKAIDDSINEPGGIVKGPYLEATPPYVTGKTIRQLVDDGILDDGFLKLGSNSFPLDRPVYAHQEEAIKKLNDGRNILVATGTGSGKTESFLIPIIDHLLKEKKAGTLGPGVRALLLYPMNALANDQVKRIREILSLDDSITFGRYTGETLQTLDRAQSEYVQREGRKQPKNELISREQMRETPPHILLTNYAMLEYLLLRPEDHEIFAGANSSSWKFIVADEAHTYDGAHGVEVALLLKKLRERIDKDGSITTIGTTATIGGDDNAKENFATNFFGNAFQIAPNKDGFRDLIEPQRKDITAGTWKFESADTWIEIKDEETFSSAASVFLAESKPTHEAFLTNHEVCELRKFLVEKPSEVSEAAQRIFGRIDSETQAAVVQIVELGSQIKDEFGSPVFQARFHLFARATEGVFSCLSEQPHAYLSRHLECPDCKAPSYELAGCKRCGGSYYAGHKFEASGKNYFRSSAPSGSSEATTYAYPIEFSIDIENEDEVNFDEVESESKEQDLDYSFLCAGCGLITSESSQECSDCGSDRMIEVRFTSVINKCEVCAGRGPSIIRRLESGNDAAASVLATSLYQDLPSAPINGLANLPGEGRKLMVFSDSRQQAAFFAPYLQDSYEKIVWRRLILKALRSAEAEHPNSSISFLDLANYAANDARSANLLAETTGVGQQNEVLSRLYGEAISTDAQNNLEGTALISWKYALPEESVAYAPLISIGFDEQNAKAFVSEILNSLRVSGIISGKPGVNLGSDLFKPRTGPLYIREKEPNRAIKTYAWLPKSASNTRLDFTGKVFSKLNITADPNTVLSGLWSALTNPAGLLPGMLTSETKSNQGIVYALNPDAVLVETVSSTTRVFQCDVCRRMAPLSVANVCPRFKCKGKLHALSQTELNRIKSDGHYASLYAQDQLISMVASEHTAQLETKYAAEVQQDFISGRVNVLSSSTTFELGVDVGELQAVLLRNMPPSVANYIQRAGRAGRRADSAALILTYAQRKPHDLSMFGDPVSMVAGKMRAPFVDLNNERILKRHIFSVFFSAFFKDSGISKLPTAGEFLSDGPSGLGNKMISWLNDHNASLKVRFLAVLPAPLRDRAEAIWAKLPDSFANRFEKVRDQFKKEVDDYRKLITELSAPENGIPAPARDLQEAARLQRSLKTITDKDLIGFLSKNNLIPKYGFPVDTVPLVPQRGSNLENKIELDRDLAVAIFDYSPGSQVIAAGVVWESVGLVLPANTEKGFPRARFATCLDCGDYQERIYKAGDVISRCNSCGSQSLNQGNYIVPEWGFHAKGGQKKPGEAIKRFAWNRSLHLKEGGVSILIAGSKTPPGVKAELRSVAKLVVINSGPGNKGFKLCPWCNQAHPTISDPKKNDHQRPYNEAKCNCNIREHVNLGHEYQTDIVHLTINTTRYKGDHRAAARSLSYALLEGASEGLQIANADIDVVCLPSTETEIKLALIDAVPGGAGFAKMIAENLNTVFDSAFIRADRCECGEEASCYQCLRSFRNQREHEELKRGLALDVLKFVLNR